MKKTARVSRDKLTLLLHGLLGVAVSILSWSAAASSIYPNGPIKIIVPAPPGGMADTVGRLVAEELHQNYKQAVIVDNQAGASGMIAAQNLARANADGHTIGIGYTAFLTAPIVGSSAIKFHPVKDFTPISQLADSVGVILVRSDHRSKSWRDLQRSKLQNGETLSFGVPGYGSTPHFFGSAIARDTGLKINTVPYRGEAAILTDLLAGSLEAAVLTPAIAMPFIKENKLVPLAVTNPKRSPALPNVPTIGELGLPTLGGASTWVGVFAPANTPEDIVRQISGVMQKMMAKPKVQERFIEKFGLVPVGSNEHEFKRLMERDLINWSSARDRYNIRME
ncbi:conserved exported hypothetical protein [Cupriavidus taiwanensis]|uniref:Extra-cytoplasmic solute receptor n=1 Tax=Cupriavidus taiwanensis TaxID=164546 RepID=A0A975XG69_9BURK|nr:tripartite tricarboxylate transporter substrate binding protein [Cupriavidus taiwanensis]SOY68891.1 conserved exported hypothetical protein [Cupriavidus taiwanensis]